MRVIRKALNLKGFLALTAVTITAAFPGVCRADIAPLSVEGGNLVAGGHIVRLRGIDWGWWHLANTHYSEEDMKQQALWGANLARLCFTYTDFEGPAHPGKISEAKVRDVDQVLDWAKKYHQYVILDEHVAPGGQDPADYCDGGGNLFWKDPGKQDRFISLWTEIARRYKNWPEVGAYELMNEPCTQSNVSDKLVDINRRTVAAIRAVDPKKVIVIAGDQWSGPDQLVDRIKMDDPNILYTFHFYDGLPAEEWLKNAAEGPGISGTQDWKHIEVTLGIPGGVSSLGILLRSSENSGTAWFDDVELTDSSGKVLLSCSFDKQAAPFHAERAVADDIAYDPTVGHGGPGSLRVKGTKSYDGWIDNPRIPVSPDQTYHLSAWVKLDHATGQTYLSAAYFGIKARAVDKAALMTMLSPAVQFRKKYNVPIWVGEFGCPRDVPAGLQHAWVSGCISAFEECGFNWTYWNYKEDAGPGGMGLVPEKHDGSNYPVNEDLLSALKAGWAMNAGQTQGKLKGG
jgi:hypothetical protein